MKAKEELFQKANEGDIEIRHSSILLPRPTKRYRSKNRILCFLSGARIIRLSAIQQIQMDGFVDSLHH